MKKLNTPRNGNYRYSISNRIEMRLERCSGHHTAISFGCEATEPEKFKEVAMSLLEPNTVMHLEMYFGTEYTHRNARDVGIDENNCHISLSIDVDPDPIINQHRIERFLDMVIDAINLCDFKAWQTHVAHEPAKTTQVTITLPGALVDQLEKLHDPAMPLSLQVENTLKQTLSSK